MTRMSALNDFLNAPDLDGKGCIAVSVGGTKSKVVRVEFGRESVELV